MSNKSFLGIPLKPSSFIMGIQHVFAMMGATILVPILTNMSISVALLSAGIGTIVFHYIAKQKVPVFLGSSFAFLGALIACIPGAGVAVAGSEVWQRAMGKVSVAIMIAGLIYLLLSIIIKYVGAAKIKKLFPPVVVGPIIILIGLNLAPTALNGITSSFMVENAEGIMVMGPDAWKGWLVALVTAGSIIGLSIFAKGLFKIIPILIGVVVGYLLSVCLNIVDFSILSNANSGWIIFQKIELDKTFFGFAKYLSFDWKVILTISPIAIVSFMEHIGDINANGAVVGKNFFEEPGLHRTVMGDGLATFAAGFIGGPCNTTYGENTAVLALTKNYNPKLLLLSGIMAVFLGIFTKVGAILGTVPSAVINGASMILFGMISAAGLRTMVDAKIDFADTKNMLITSLILVLGIGLKNVAIGGIPVSSLAIATIVGVLLNVILPNKKESFIAPKASAGSDVISNKSETTFDKNVEKADQEIIEK